MLDKQGLHFTKWSAIHLSTAWNKNIPGTLIIWWIMTWTYTHKHIFINKSSHKNYRDWSFVCSVTVADSKNVQRKKQTNKQKQDSKLKIQTSLQLVLIFWCHAMQALRSIVRWLRQTAAKETRLPNPVTLHHVQQFRSTWTIQCLLLMHKSDVNVMIEVGIIVDAVDMLQLVKKSSELKNATLLLQDLFVIIQEKVWEMIEACTFCVGVNFLCNRRQFNTLEGVWFITLISFVAHHFMAFGVLIINQNWLASPVVFVNKCFFSLRFFNKATTTVYVYTLTRPLKRFWGCGIFGLKIIGEMG